MTMIDSELVLTEEQQLAVDKIKQWAQSPLSTMISLSGAAGTGKTYLTNKIKSLLPTETAWTAMTGRAAMRLSELAGVEVTTLHSAIYKPPLQNGKYLNFAMMKKPACRVLAIDEASMLSPRIWKDLDDWVRQGVKILFIGDGFQLPPVMSLKEEQEFGSDFIIFREVKGPTLTKVMRSDGGIIDIVSTIRETKRMPTTGNNVVKIQQVPYPGMAAVSDYLNDPEDHILITWTNRMRMQGNAHIRKKLGHSEVLPMPGEPVLICKNGQDRLNGEKVYVDKLERGPSLAEVDTMWLTTSDGQDILVSVKGKDQPVDGFMPDIKDWKLYHWYRNKEKLPEPLPITYGYVLTCHKAQGSESKRVTVYLSGSDLDNDNFNKITKLPDGTQMPFGIRWGYTSCSRARSQLTLYTGC